MPDKSARNGFNDIIQQKSDNYHNKHGEKTNKFNEKYFCWNNYEKRIQNPEQYRIVERKCRHQKYRIAKK
jgi:hypothetical protein